MNNNPQHFNLITNLEDIQNRPNYIEKIKVNHGENVDDIFLDLVGYYLFKDKVKCGISSCGTKHQKGYIASLKCGSEIIIGHKCGNKYFGVSFDEKCSQFAHLRNNAREYIQLRDFFEQLEGHKLNFEQIKNGSGTLNFIQIKKAIQDFKETAFNYWMRKVIEREVSYLGAIEQEVFKTQEELNAEYLMGKNNVLDTKRIVVARIEDYQVVAKWHEAEKLKDYFEKVHRELKHPNQLQGNEIKRLTKLLRAYDQNLREFQDYCTSANKFLQQQNLLQLTVLFDKYNEKQVIEKFAARFG